MQVAHICRAFWMYVMSLWCWGNMWCVWPRQLALFIHRGLWISVVCISVRFVWSGFFLCILRMGLVMVLGVGLGVDVDGCACVGV